MIPAERIGLFIVASAILLFVLASAYGLWVYYRGRRERLCRGTPLARLRYDGRHWRRFLGLELRKHAVFPATLAVAMLLILALFAAGEAVYELFQPSFDLRKTAWDMVIFGWPIMLALVAGLPLLALTVALIERSFIRWLFLPAARREVILYADGALIGKAAIVWANGKATLWKASVSPDRTLLTLELERRNDASESAPPWTSDVISFPIPPGQDVTRFLREATTSPSHRDDPPG